MDLETSRDLTCFIILVQQHELEWMGVDDSFGILCWHRVRQKLWFEKKTPNISSFSLSLHLLSYHLNFNCISYFLWNDFLIYCLTFFIIY